MRGSALRLWNSKAQVCAAQACRWKEDQKHWRSSMCPAATRCASSPTSLHGLFWR